MRPLAEPPTASAGWSSPTVRSVMTLRPITVQMSTAFDDIQQLLDRHQVNAVPVLNAFGEPVGVVSEADLVVASARQANRDHRMAEAPVAKDLMTAPVDTVDADLPLTEAAGRLVRSSCGRLFATSWGQLVGVLARSDLWRVFDRPDTNLLADVATALNRHAPDCPVSVSVDDGVVTLLGVVPKRSTAAYLTELAAEVAGVVAVHNLLGYIVDDRAWSQEGGER